MRPTWIDEKLGVELHKPDAVILKKARIIGQMLLELHQPEGQELVDATETILQRFGKMASGGDHEN